jgi:hypothetical protein
MGPWSDNCTVIIAGVLFVLLHLAFHLTRDLSGSTLGSFQLKKEDTPTP